MQNSQPKSKIKLPQTKTLLIASVLVAIVTIGLKTGAWWITGSVALLSDAMESFVNLASAVFALAMVTLAEQPPDDSYQYGRSKAEYFSSGFEGTLILGAALGIIWSAMPRLWQPTALVQLDLGLVLSLLSTALNGGLAWIMLRTAKVRKSIALEADGKHLMTDVWTSVGVVLGLIGAWWTDWLWLDAAVAIGVALNIVREGAHLIIRSFQGLLDSALDESDMAAIQKVLQEFSHSRPPDGTAAAAKPIVRFDHLYTRQAGQRKFAEAHMHMPAQWTLGRATALRLSAEQALMDAVPGLHANLKLLPGDVEDLHHGHTTTVPT